MHTTAMVIRWTARILSVPIILGLAYLTFMYAFGSERSLPGNTKEIIAYIAMIVSFLALGFSWRWEHIGSITSLVAIVIVVAFNWHAILTPIIAIPVDAVLFLLSWWLNKNAVLTA